jgi:phosphate transport system permease protein
MLRLVPDQLREASYALGVPQWRTVLRVVYPTALPGMVTGTLLAVARAVGETAPVLLLVFVNNKINTNPFSGPQASLSVFTFQNAALPNNTAVDRAWTAGLTLIIIVLVLSLIARLVTRRNRLAR